MIDRRKKIKELLANLHSMKRIMDFRSPDSLKLAQITPSQWGVLMYVEKNQGNTIKDVAKYLNMTSSAVTQLVDGLVNNGYLIRTTGVSDRRIVTLSLSKEMTRKIKKMKDKTLERFLEFFQGLEDDEFNQYVSLSNKIVQSLLSKK